MNKQLIRIVADENILGLENYFSNNAAVNFQIKTVAGRSLTNADVKACDVLLVRSVTHVNQSLLDGSSVGFVGTATSGVEHIDENYLHAQQITFADAKGANANAVAEYIVASIASLSLRDHKNYFEKNIAIVGHGYVGKALQKKLKAFNASVKIYDPFLSELSHTNINNNFYCEWGDVVNSDLISFHVPFTETGRFPTKKIVNKDFLEAISSECIVLNAARGEICDESFLLKKIKNSNIKIVVDVWNNEPIISEKLLETVDIATPHIAGYSLNAKFNATAILAKKVYAHLGINEFCVVNDSIKKIKLNYPKAVDDCFDIFRLILLAYDPVVDTQHLRNKQSTPLHEHFDFLRKHYTHRLEWEYFDLSSLTMKEKEKSILANLGFVMGKQTT